MLPKVRAIVVFPQRMQASKELNFFFFFFAALADTEQLLSFLPTGGWQFDSHQAPGPPLHLHSEHRALCLQLGGKVGGLAFLTEKIRNDWMPVKQAQLSGSEVGWGRALTAK